MMTYSLSSKTNHMELGTRLFISLKKKKTEVLHLRGVRFVSLHRRKLCVGGLL